MENEEVLEETEESYEDYTKLYERLEKINRYVEDLGFTPQTFRQLLEEAKVLDEDDEIESAEALDKVESFIEDNTNTLKDIVEVLKLQEKVRNTTYYEELRTAMKESGISDDLMDEENRQKMRQFYETYTPPVTEIVIDAKLLKHIANAIEWLTDDSRINFNEDGIEIKAVDPANVCMVAISVDKRSFVSYETPNRTIGISWSDVSRVLNKQYHVFDPSDDNNLTITIRDYMEIRDDTNRKVRLSLIDPSAIRREPKAPIVDFNAETTIDYLDRIVKAYKQFDEKIRISVSDGTTHIIAKNDLNMIEDRFDSGEGSGRSIYSIEYLENIAKSLARFTSEVNVKFSTNYPAEFYYDGGDVRIKYLLAPRIEDDMEEDDKEDSKEDKEICPICKHTTKDGICEIHGYVGE